MWTTLLGNTTLVLRVRNFHANETSYLEKYGMLGYCVVSYTHT